VPLPHVTLHAVEPEQSTEQPPPGQVTLQVLLPPHATLAPDAIVRLHVLLPWQVKVLPAPAEIEHVLPPVHVELHPEPQVPLHCDLPAQLVVHPVPQLTLQSFFDWQSKVAPLGGGVPASPSPPSVQVPPDAQLHVEPLHEHAPLQSGELVDELPEQATRMQVSIAGSDSL
jgi:hypothetical protein